MARTVVRKKTTKASKIRVVSRVEHVILPEMRRKTQAYNLKCGWCFAPKVHVHERCACGCYMTTQYEQSQVSNVYVEDIPAA